MNRHSTTQRKYKNIEYHTVICTMCKNTIDLSEPKCRIYIDTKGGYVSHFTCIDNHAILLEIDTCVRDKSILGIDVNKSVTEFNCVNSKLMGDSMATVIDKVISYIMILICKSDKATWGIYDRESDTYYNTNFPDLIRDVRFKTTTRLMYTDDAVKRLRQNNISDITLTEIPSIITIKENLV